MEGAVIQDVLLIGYAPRAGQAMEFPVRNPNSLALVPAPNTEGIGVAPHPAVQGAEGIGDALTEGQVPELLKKSAQDSFHDGYNRRLPHPRPPPSGTTRFRICSRRWGVTSSGSSTCINSCVPQKDCQGPAGTVGPPPGPTKIRVHSGRPPAAPAGTTGTRQQQSGPAGRPPGPADRLPLSRRGPRSS